MEVTSLEDAHLRSTSVRKRMMVALFASQSLFSVSTIASFTLMPIISAHLGGSDSAAGVPATVTLLGRGLAAYPAGWLMDRIGRRPGLSLGYLSVTVGGLLSVLSISQWESFLGFCLGGFLLGAGRGVIEQARFVAAEIHPPDRRADAIGWIVFAGTVGAIGGPLLVEPSSAVAAAEGLDGYTGPYAAATVLTVTLCYSCSCFFDPIRCVSAKPTRPAMTPRFRAAADLYPKSIPMAVCALVCLP